MKHLILILVSVLMFFITSTNFVMAQSSGGIPGEYMYDIDSRCLEKRLTNPSQFIFVERQEALFVDNLLFDGINFVTFNYAYPIRLFGTAAITTLLLHNGGIEARDGLNNPLKSYSQTDFVLLLSYAHQLYTGLSVGANVKTVVISSSKFDGGAQLQGVSATGEGIDLGVSYRLLKELDVGLGLVNFVFFKLAGDKALYNKWPFNLKLTLDYTTLNNKLRMGFDANLLDVFPNKKLFPQTLSRLTPKMKYALEYSIRKWFSLSGVADEKSYYIGMKYTGKDLLSWGEDLEINYHTGYNYQIQNAVNRLELIARWGASRENLETARIFKKQNMAALNAYKKAMRLYRKKQYLQAAIAFGKVVKLYPEFKQLDNAKFYIGESLYGMGLYNASKFIYKRVMNDHPEFKNLDLLTYRLQEISFKNEKFGEVLTSYNSIASTFPESEILDDAQYLAGQAAYKLGNIYKAMDLYNAIPRNSNVYKFAQYSVALSYLYVHHTYLAIAHFNSLLVTKGVDELDKMIDNKAHVTLGHVYYELFDFDNAIAEYNKVKKGQSFYDGALIGHAWSLVKKGKYKESIDVLEGFKGMENSNFFNESLLLKGYCFALIRDFKKAEKEFTTVKGRIKLEIEGDGADVTKGNQSLVKLLSEIKMQKAQLLATEASIFKSVFQKATKMQDSDIRKFNKEIESKLNILDDLKDNFRKVMLRLERVDKVKKMLQDAEYAAITTKHLVVIQDKREVDKAFDKEISTKEEELLKKLKELEESKR